MSLHSFLTWSQEQKVKLPKELKESSALIVYQNTFLTINDSGNEPKIYQFNRRGEIIHTAYLTNAKNIDWEAMAFDGKEYLFIGDIGNNSNKRKDLCIYKVPITKILEEDTVFAEKIEFSYPEQINFPPEKSSLYYDAEGMIIKDGNLLIFTKNRTIPFDGIVKIYEIPTNSEVSYARLIGEIQLPASNWKIDSVTDASIHEEEIFLLTYTKIYTLQSIDNHWQIKKVIEHSEWTQKEGMYVDNENFYLTDENSLGIFKGNFLYIQKR